MATKAQIIALQKQLLAAGFNPGPIDGIMGPRTRAAQQQFQAQQIAQQQQVQAAPTPAPMAAPMQPAATPAPVAAPPVPDLNAMQNSIYTDPAYLAFIRASDMDLEEAARQVARKQQALQTSTALRMPQIQQQGEERRKQIAGSAEARGLFRSGQRLADEAKAEQDQAAQISQLQSDTAGQMAGYQEELASRIAAKQREAAERGFNTAQTQDYDKRLEGLRAKYPAQYGAKV